MHHGEEHHPPRWLGITIGIVTGLLLLGWLLFRWDAFLKDQNGWIRFSLSTLFAILLVARPKPKRSRTGIPWWGATALVGAGTFATILGLILPIQQLEWIGIECVAAGILCWALPGYAHRDIGLASLLLYWAVPLPDALFTGLQGSMQHLSVKGAEAFLQMVNIRAWAYQTALYTPSATYEVPGWCSGMRTATTILLLSLGMCMLRRIRVRYAVAFTALAELQVLLLNILRISLMVILVPALNSDRAIDFLHNTTGLLVIAALFLVAAELAIVVHIRNRFLHAKYELDEHKMRHVTEHPPFWRELGHKKPLLLTLLVAVIVTGAVVNRARRYHRAQMVKDVASGQRDLGNLDVAMAAANKVLQMTPDDVSWKLAAIRLKLLRGEHEEVIRDLDELPEVAGRNSMQAKVLRAYALMSLGEIEAAATIVESLPEETKRTDPRAAMVLAEIAMRSSKPEETAAYVLTASRWSPNTGRIRNLYPYLRVHRQWNTLIDADTGQTFTNPVHAFSLLEALMNLNRITSVAERTRQFLEQWPNDPRLLEPLYFMALQSQTELWQRRFADHLLTCLPDMDTPERLYELTFKCLELHRPDLAWAITAHLKAVAPSSPAIPMAAAVHGHRWLKYSRQHLELPLLPNQPAEDIARLAHIAKMLPAWQATLDTLPFVETFATADEPLAIRKSALQEALTAFDAAMDSTNTPPLSLDMHYLYVHALERSGKLRKAEEQLQEIRRLHPNEAAGTRALLSAIHERAGHWIDVYETLHDYIEHPEGGSAPLDTEQLSTSWKPFLSEGTIHRTHHIDPLIRLGRAQRELNLGIAASHTARFTAKLFRYAPQSQALLTSCLFEYESPSEAMRSIGSPHFHPYQELDYLEAQILYRTQRYSALQELAATRILPHLRIPPDAPQDTSLPPAELVLLWHQFQTPSEADFAQHHASIQQNLKSATTSPWLHGLLTLWSEAYTSRCAPHTASPDTWEQLGRTHAERATALNQLTLLLCRERRIPEARTAAHRALEHLPNDPTLWLIAISLDNGNPDTIAAARAQCPDHGPIWLAELVAHTSAATTPEIRPQNSDTNWINAHISTALASTFATETLTRAADYLLRHQLPQQAATLMRHAEPNAEGLLPAHILSIRCALQTEDPQWAIRSTQQAIYTSHYPLPKLFKQLITLKTADGELTADAAIINALLNLKQLEPDATLWPQMLGYLRFQHGGWDIIDALSSMSVALDQGATNQLPFVVAAEAARLLHDVDKSIDLLKEALKHHPEDPLLINNLAFTLAHEEAHIAEATQWLPQLASMADKRNDVLDTMSYVLLRAKRSKDAYELASQLVHRASPGSRYWVRGTRYMAEATWQEGNHPRAMRMLTDLIEGQKSMTEEDMREITQLLARISDEHAGPEPIRRSPVIPAPPPLNIPELPTAPKVEP